MTITTIITNEWLTFKDLEQKLQIAGPTLRRWSEKFPTFLGSKKINRVLSFPASSLEVFKLIKQLFDDGNDTAAVMAALTREMTQTHDVKPIPKDAPPPSPAPDLESLHELAPLVGVLADLSKSFQKLVENQERMLEEMRLTRISLEASRMPLDAPEGFKRGNVHGMDTEAKDGPHMARPDSTKLHEVRMPRQEVIAEAHRLRGLGYGAARIRTAMVRAGFPSLNGKGQLSKSTVSKIIKGEIK